MGADQGPVRSLSAVTLGTTDMLRSFRFYDALGLALNYGGPDSSFTSWFAGDGHLNVQLDPAYRPGPLWGRVILWVDDVDDMYRTAVSAGLRPSTRPEDAPWGERYFHLSDPDGHELSFARPLEGDPGDPR